MKSIKIKAENGGRATGVWYDSATGRLSVLFGSILRNLELDLIPLKDFESASDIVGFALGMKGAVVVCRHEDGLETWLPVDMWFPGGFTPRAAKPRGRSKSYADVSPLAQRLIAVRTSTGITQKKAAYIAETPIRTIQEWEQGRHLPTKARAKEYICSIERAFGSFRIAPGKKRADARSRKSKA